MEPNMNPKLVIDQMETLKDLHSENFKAIDASIRNAMTALEIESLHNVYAFGDGDSYHAAIAAEMAFLEFSPVSYQPLNSMQFMEYRANYLPVNFPRDTLVVGISASGSTKRVAQSLERAKKFSDKVITAGLVGNTDSRVAKAADKVLSTEIPELGRAPGIRTYVASLMGLLSLAIRIGEIKGKLTQEDANGFRNVIVEMATAVEATYRASIEPAKKALELSLEAPFISYVGSGPSFGTASFSSAKLVEAAGVFGAVQDLEEWAHVERFAYPLDFPVFIIAPPGKSYWRALELAKGVKLLGHPLLAVIDADDKEIREIADVVFPVMGQVEEPLSPLLYYIASTTFSYFIAKELSRSLFMTDNEHIMKIRQEMMKQIR